VEFCSARPEPSEMRVHASPWLVRSQTAWIATAPDAWLPPEMPRHSPLWKSFISCDPARGAVAALALVGATSTESASAATAAPAISAPTRALFLGKFMEGSKVPYGLMTPTPCPTGLDEMLTWARQGGRSSATARTARR
jgi:hypothetical protein